MRLRLSVPALLLVIASLALLAGCGDDSLGQSTTAPPTSDPSGGSVSSPPQSDGTGLPGAAQPAPIRSRTDLVDARVFQPDSVTADPTNNQRLAIRFWGGVEPCFGAEVRVVESATDVKVTVLAGSPPSAREQVCIALAKFYEATVDLTSPLGTRAIVVTK